MYTIFQTERASKPYNFYINLSESPNLIEFMEYVWFRDLLFDFRKMVNL